MARIAIDWRWRDLAPPDRVRIAREVWDAHGITRTRDAVEALRRASAAVPSATFRAAVEARGLVLLEATAGAVRARHGGFHDRRGARVGANPRARIDVAAPWPASLPVWLPTAFARGGPHVRFPESFPTTAALSKFLAELRPCVVRAHARARVDVGEVPHAVAWTGDDWRVTELQADAVTVAARALLDAATRGELGPDVSTVRFTTPWIPASAFGSVERRLDEARVAEALVVDASREAALAATPWRPTPVRLAPRDGFELAVLAEATGRSLDECVGRATVPLRASTATAGPLVGWTCDATEDELVATWDGSHVYARLERRGWSWTMPAPVLDVLVVDDAVWALDALGTVQRLHAQSLGAAHRVPGARRLVAARPEPLVAGRRGVTDLRGRPCGPCPDALDALEHAGRSWVLTDAAVLAGRADEGLRAYEIPASGAPRSPVDLHAARLALFGERVHALLGGAIHRLDDVGLVRLEFEFELEHALAGPPRHLVASPAWLAVADDRTALVFDLGYRVARRIVFQSSYATDDGLPVGILGLAFSARGRLVVALAGGEANLFDACEPKGWTPRMRQAGVRRRLVLLDGRMLLSG